MSAERKLQRYGSHMAVPVNRTHLLDPLTNSACIPPLSTTRLEEEEAWEGGKGEGEEEGRIKASPIV